MMVFLLQLEKAVEKELAWFRATIQGLDNLKVINLDADVIASQLYEQKVSFYTYEFHSFPKITIALRIAQY